MMLLLPFLSLKLKEKKLFFSSLDSSIFIIWLMIKIQATHSCDTLSMYTYLRETWSCKAYRLYILDTAYWLSIQLFLFQRFRSSILLIKKVGDLSEKKLFFFWMCECVCWEEERTRVKATTIYNGTSMNNVDV